MGIKIQEVSKNEYKVIGTLNVMTRKSKSVVVDGEDYIKTWIEDVETNAEDLHIVKIELDELECFGFNASVWEHQFMYNGIFESECGKESKYILSTNQYVAYWQWMHETKRLPTWIKDVYIDNNNRRVSGNVKSTCRVKIYSYGFNNTLYAEIDWSIVFACKNKKDNKKHFGSIDNYLKEYGINIYADNEKQMVNNAIKLLTKQSYNR